MPHQYHFYAAVFDGNTFSHEVDGLITTPERRITEEDMNGLRQGVLEKHGGEIPVIRNLTYLGEIVTTSSCDEACSEPPGPIPRGYHAEYRGVAWSNGNQDADFLVCTPPQKTHTVNFAKVPRARPDAHYWELTRKKEESHSITAPADIPGGYRALYRGEGWKNGYQPANYIVRLSGHKGSRAYFGTWPEGTPGSHYWELILSLDGFEQPNTVES